MLAKKFHFPARGASRLKSSYRSRHFIFRERQNALPFSRFGVVISKSVHRMATHRNKTKRAIFNFLRLKHAHRRAGRDILIIALPRAANLKNEEVQKELGEFFRQQIKQTI